MIRERNQSFKLALIALDSFAVFFSFILAFTLHFRFLFPERLPEVVATGEFLSELGLENPQVQGIFSYFVLGLLMAITQIIVFIAQDQYRPRRGQLPLREVVSIFRGVFINLAVILALLFFYRGVSFSRGVLALSTIFSAVLISVAHYAFRRLMEKLRARGFNTRDVLILGTGRLARRFFDILSRHSIYGYRVVGFLGPARGADPALRKLILGPVGNLKTATVKYRPQMVVYALPLEAAMLRPVIDHCDQEGLDLRIVPDLLELVTHRASIADMDGLPILTLHDIPLKNGYNRFLKRAFDVLVSATAILLLSPLIALLALLIKATSRGPVLFRQERVGLDQRTFNLIKFRTMEVVARNKSDTTWSSTADNRITGMGRFLRKTSLDELPQLWNVLCGDMSIVGPRPERMHFVQKFKNQYHQYMRRHTVKAGLTGWAQIKGLRGDTSIEKRVEADIYYIENWSFWFDLMIILKTIPALFKFPGE